MLDNEENNFLNIHFYERDFFKIKTKYNKKLDEHQSGEFDLIKKISSKRKKSNQYNIDFHKQNTEEQSKRKKSADEDSFRKVNGSNNSSPKKDSSSKEL